MIIHQQNADLLVFIFALFGLGHVSCRLIDSATAPDANAAECLSILQQSPWGAQLY
jgi:hypothetical protein